MEDEAVAWFEIRTAGDDLCNTHANIEICGNEQFVLGRDPECRYYWTDDLTISREHLRIHCILYDQDPDSKIAPFVYATDLSVNGTFLKKKKKKNSECAGSQGRGISMGLGGTFLLDDGDELHISESIMLIFHSTKPIPEVAFHGIHEREKAIFAQDYLVTGRLLGQGAYGMVLIGVDQATQRQLACKMVRLDRLYSRPPFPSLQLPTGQHEEKAMVGKKRWPTLVTACFREFDILKDLSHPNIISITKVFWSNNTIYLFQELVTGGDLFSYLAYKGGKLENALATVIMRQVLLGVEYLHAQDIVHRDLKPDNILMTSLDDGARVVITDFGNARLLQSAYSETTAKCQRMHSRVGTVEYAAPEIHKKNPTMLAEEGYSKSVDMWSLGSITAVLLTGGHIFLDCAHPNYDEDSQEVISDLAARCDLSVLDDEYHPWWRHVAHAPKDFIKRLLVLDENDRMTATEALEHVWFTNKCYAEDLKDLCARSVKDWRPRPENSQLVERISKSLPDLTAIGLPGHAMNHQTVSHFFHPSEQQLTHNIVQTLSNSQHWCAETPMPSIRDDYANRRLHFASQIAPSSYETGSATDNPGSLGSSDQQQIQHYDDYDAFQHGENHNAGMDEATSEPFEATFQPEHPSSECAVQDEYDPGSRESHHDGSYKSVESLNDVQAVAYTQYPYLANVRQSQDYAQLRLTQLPETPLTQDVADQDLSLEDSYQQTRFPEEHQMSLDTAEENSVLVFETPPGN